MIDLIEHLLIKELKLSDCMVDNLFSIFDDYGIVGWENDTVLMIEFTDLILFEIKSTVCDHTLNWAHLMEGVKNIAENYSYGEF